MSKKTDLRYGRRGGYFAPDNYTPTDFASGNICDVCGLRTILNQPGSRHYVCDTESMVGKSCVCAAGCTIEMVGDGGCDPSCVPCRLQQNKVYSDVNEWRRFK